MTAPRLTDEEARVLRATEGVREASGVPSVHAIAVAADLRDDRAQAVAESLAERGLLRADVSSDAVQHSEWLATRRYVLTDAGAEVLRGIG